jgi:hypothetical protein
MELNPQNAFGELLLDLIEAQYEGVMDDGIMALMEATGLSEEEVTSIINGDIVVDSEDLLSNIIGAFPDADDDDISMIIDVAVGVDEADKADLQANLDDLDGEGQLEAPEMSGADPAAAGGEGGEGGFNRRMNSAEFTALANAYKAQQAQLEQITTGVSNFQATESLRNRLKDIDVTTNAYVERGMLPPSYKSMLVGNFKDDNERLAKFASVAAQNGVDVDTMLFATEYAAGMMADAVQFVEFKDHSLSDEDAAIAEFSANLDAVVAQDFDAIFN